MPRLAAMSVCESPRSRRRRRMRGPRNSFAADTHTALSISPNYDKSCFDKQTLFAAAKLGVRVFSLAIHSANRSEKSAMAIFDQCISAPTGRFDGITRPYSPEDVLRLRGSFAVEHTLA